MTATGRAYFTRQRIYAHSFPHVHWPARSCTPPSLRPPLPHVSLPPPSTRRTHIALNCPSSLHGPSKTPLRNRGRGFGRTHEFVTGCCDSVDGFRGAVLVARARRARAEKASEARRDQLPCRAAAASGDAAAGGRCVPARDAPCRKEATCVGLGVLWSVTGVCVSPRLQTPLALYPSRLSLFPLI